MTVLPPAVVLCDQVAVTHSSEIGNGLPRITFPIQPEAPHDFRYLVDAYAHLSRTASLAIGSENIYSMDNRCELTSVGDNSASWPVKIKI